jgi:group I intron endonuclease
MREGIIYLITNKVNGKKYVGQTVKALKHRWNQHKRDARVGSTQSLHCAVRKYGPTSFTIEVIAASLEPFLNDLETFFIQMHCSRTKQHGYNMTAGGDGAGAGEDNHRFGKKLSEETRRKISEAHKGKTLSAAHRAAISAGNKGHIAHNKGAKHTDDARIKMSESHKGEKNHFYGKTHSEESIRKQREAKKGKLLPAETKLKLMGRIPSFTGKTHSEDARRKMSAAKKGRIPWNKGIKKPSQPLAA